MSDSPRRSGDASPIIKGPEPPPQSSPSMTAEVTHLSPATTAAAADSIGRKSVSQIIAGWSPKPASGSPSVFVSRPWPPVSTSTTTAASVSVSASSAAAVSPTPIPMSHQGEVSPSPLPPSTSTSSGGDAVLHRDDSIVFAPLHNQNNNGGNQSTTYYPPPPPTKYLPPPVDSPTDSTTMDTTDMEDEIPSAKALPPTPNTTTVNVTITEVSSDIIPLSIHTEQDEIPVSIPPASKTVAAAATGDEIPDSTKVVNVVISPPSESPFSPSRDTATRSYSPDPLPAGWTEHLDLTSGHVYYANGSTGESQWNIPTLLPPPPAAYYQPPPAPTTYSPSKPPATNTLPTASTPKRSWLGSLLGGSKSPANSPKK